jgi:hypothetical protein
MSGTQTGFVDSLVSAARQHPLAAALIGGGGFWLLIGNEKLKRAAHSATASPVVEIGARNLRSAASIFEHAAPPTAPEMDHTRSFQEGKTSDAGGMTSEASGTTHKIRDRFDEGIAYARENIGNPLPGKEAFAKAQTSLTDAFERQPLLLGAVGLVIGATVAGAFRSSDLEKEWMGELSDDVKADLNTRAKAVSQSVREASDTLKAEISDTGAEAVDRVKQAGVDAADAAREKVKSP